MDVEQWRRTRPACRWRPHSLFFSRKKSGVAPPLRGGRVKWSSMKLSVQTKPNQMDGSCPWKMEKSVKINSVCFHARQTLQGTHKQNEHGHTHTLQKHHLYSFGGSQMWKWYVNMACVLKQASSWERQIKGIGGSVSDSAWYYVAEWSISQIR